MLIFTFLEKRRATTSKTSSKKCYKLGKPKWLINLVQTKASSDPTRVVKASEIHEWYQAGQSLDLLGFLPVFTYYTNNKGIEWDKKSDTASWTIESLLDECPNLVLMSRAQLKEYLSPTFAPLCRLKE
jgi:hypothetical protein